MGIGKKIGKWKVTLLLWSSWKKLVKSQCYGVQMGIGNMLSKYQYPFVPRSIAIWRVFFMDFYNKNECPFHFPIFSNPIQLNWSWIFGYFLKNFWAYLWLESKTMVFVRSSKVTNGWLVTIRDPESVIVTLQGYALQGYNGFLGVTHGYQFHWSLSRTLQMVHFFFLYLNFRVPYMLNCLV